jgi:hypothetical protein
MLQFSLLLDLANYFDVGLIRNRGHHQFAEQPRPIRY